MRGSHGQSGALGVEKVGVLDDEVGGTGQLIGPHLAAPAQVRPLDGGRTHLLGARDQVSTLGAQGAHAVQGDLDLRGQAHPGSLGLGTGLVQVRTMARVDVLSAGRAGRRIRGYDRPGELGLRTTGGVEIGLRRGERGVEHEQVGREHRVVAGQEQAFEHGEALVAAVELALAGLAVSEDGLRLLGTRDRLLEGALLCGDAGDVDVAQPSELGAHVIPRRLSRAQLVIDAGEGLLRCVHETFRAGVLTVGLRPRLVQSVAGRQVAVEVADRLHGRGMRAGERVKLGLQVGDALGVLVDLRG